MSKCSGGDNDNASLHTFTFEGTVWTNAPCSKMPAEHGCGSVQLRRFNEYEDGRIAIALGCIDEMACNYDPQANTDSGDCTYAALYYDCDGVWLNDADSDGVCDEIEIEGCTDPMALNYSAEATDDDGSCMYCTLSASVAVSDVSCAGADDGLVTVLASGACRFKCIGVHVAPIGYSTARFHFHGSLRRLVRCGSGR